MMFGSWSEDDGPERESDRFEFSATVEQETEKAYRLDDGVKKRWFPKSQLRWEGKNLWSLPEWLAKKEGLC